jgi:hypothetical protein
MVLIFAIVTALVIFSMLRCMAKPLLILAAAGVLLYLFHVI